MSKVSISIPKQSIKRLTKKLEKMQKLAFDSRGPVVHFLVEEVGAQYRDAILSGMGVVPPGGGSVALKPVQGLQASVTFHALSDWTSEKKEAKRDWNLNIWMATGETADAVRVHPPTTTPRGAQVFSGILGQTDRDALEKAILVEFGLDDEAIKESWEGRPLFTVLNAVLVRHRKQLFHNISQALKQTALAAGWGTSR